MNTLIQNTAGLFIPFYNQYIVYAAPFRSYCRCQACRAGSHNQNVSVHVTPCYIRMDFEATHEATYLCADFTRPQNPQLTHPFFHSAYIKIFDSPPHFVICSGATFSSLARISKVFGEQKPDWHLPMPALVLRFMPSSVVAPTGL